MDKQDLLTRLRRIEGQVRGLQRMIEEERDCEAFVQQLAAARKALDKVGLLAITHRVSECLGLDRRGGTVDRSALEDTLKLFSHIS